MKITITNNIALNGGDAAILLGMLKALRIRFGKDTEFIVSGTYPEVCAQLYPKIKWRWTLGGAAVNTPFNHIRVIGRIARFINRYRFILSAYLRRYNIQLYRLFLDAYNLETLNEYATSDIIISSGGTYLIEHYGITSLYIDYRISLILRKPLIQYTQSIGSFSRPHNIKRLRWVFNHCSSILLRDQKSVENVVSLNLEDYSVIHVVPDAAFALGSIEKILERKDDNLRKYGNVAISVREWIHAADKNTMPNYRKCIADTVTKLVDIGYNVHFISTCQGISYYTNDNIVVDEILSLIPDNYKHKIVKYDEYLSINQILNLLVQMDFIIATRLHMSILALISGVPVFPIAYEFKTIELFHSLGYQKIEEIEKLESSALFGSLKTFMAWYTPAQRIEINNQVSQLINGALVAANYI